MAHHFLFLYKRVRKYQKAWTPQPWYHSQHPNYDNMSKDGTLKQHAKRQLIFFNLSTHTWDCKHIRWILPINANQKHGKILLLVFNVSFHIDPKSGPKGSAKAPLPRLEATRSSSLTQVLSLAQLRSLKSTQWRSKAGDTKASSGTK